MVAVTLLGAAVHPKAGFDEFTFIIEVVVFFIIAFTIPILATLDAKVVVGQTRQIAGSPT